MKVIEKTDEYGLTQYFEVLTSRKELREYIKQMWADALWCNAYHEGIQEEDATPEMWEDCDVAYVINGQESAFGEGDLLPRRPNANRIERFISTNSHTTVMYGDIPVEYDADAEAWLARW